MTGYLAAAIVTAVLAAPLVMAAIVSAVRRATRVDWLTSIVPQLLWFALAASGIGVKSLSNLIELLILSVLLAGILSLRLFLDTEIPSRAAWIGFLVGCLSSVAVYFAVPLLPE